MNKKKQAKHTSSANPARGKHELQVLPVMQNPDRPTYRDVHPNLLKPPFRMAVVGSSKSGKSNYVVNLLRPCYYGGGKMNGKKVPPCFEKIYIFSPNIGMDDTTRCFQKLCQEQDIKQDYNDGYIRQIIENQKAKSPHEEKVLIIADDLPGLGAKPDAMIFTSASYLRHLNVSIIYISQVYKGRVGGLPPLVRNNIDALCMFRMPSEKQIRDFCEDMAGTFNSKKNVHNLLAYATMEPFQFAFFNYRDLNVWKNHTQLLWKKYTKDMQFSPDFTVPKEVESSGDEDEESSEDEEETDDEED